MSELVPVTPDSPAALINRELSWLSFARRVLALAEDPEQPLLERVKFAGIMGMIYDEFAMKRIGGLFRQVRRGKGSRGPDGLTPAEVAGTAASCGLRCRPTGRDGCRCRTTRAGCPWRR